MQKQIYQKLLFFDKFIYEDIKNYLTLSLGIMSKANPTQIQRNDFNKSVVKLYSLDGIMFQNNNVFKEIENIIEALDITDSQSVSNLKKISKIIIINASKFDPLIDYSSNY